MATLTVYAGIDSFIGGTTIDENMNYGAAVMIDHRLNYADGKSYWRRGIGNFDVSELSGATINSAKLVRYVYDIVNGGQSAKLSRCTRPSQWTESGVTWNKYDGTNSWTAAGGDYDDTGPPAAITYTEPSSTGWHEITGLKDFVEDALANRSGIVSIITRLSDEAPETDVTYRWYSKNRGSDIWHLVIDYTPAAPARLTERGFLRGVQRGVLRGG